MCRLLYILFFFCCIYGCAVVSADEVECSVKEETNSPAHRLKQHLLECGYDRTVRAVAYHTNRTYVTVSMMLRILNVPYYMTGISLHTWMVWEWKDNLLHWNPLDYEGIDNLNVDSSDIWVPEVAQFASTAVWEAERSLVSGSCTLKYTGDVKCVPSSVYNVKCLPDLTYWPYDVLNCSLRLGAWMQSGEEITLTVDQTDVDLREFEQDREWFLESATVRRHVEKYLSNNTFPWIQYSFFLRRHYSLYESVIVFPGILFGVLVLTTFWMMPQGANRINLCCVILICHYIQLQYLAWMLQNNGDKCPLAVLFYRDSLILSVMALLSAILSRVLFSTAMAPPQYVNTVTSWMLSCRAGQVLLLSQVSPEVVATAEEDGKEEGAGLVASTSVETVKSWTLFRKFMDRIFFFIFFLLYLYMIVRFFV